MTTPALIGQLGLMAFASVRAVRMTVVRDGAMTRAFGMTMMMTTTPMAGTG